MTDLFQPDFFKRNRRRLVEQLKRKAPIIISANGLMQRGGDLTFEFIQDANFWYLTGIDEPDILLVIDGHDEYLILPNRPRSLMVMEGPLDVTHLKNVSGIKHVYKFDQGWQTLSLRLQETKLGATLASSPPYIEELGIYTNPARASLINKLKEIKPELKLLDLRLNLARLRMVKQPPELCAIEKAIDITIEALKYVSSPARLKKYNYEYQIEADISWQFRSRGASGHGFRPIVASGPKGSTVHDETNNSRLANRSLVTIDVGALQNNYTADLTRTISFGKPTKRQQAVYAAVLDVQEQAIKMLRPGVIIRDYETEIEQLIGQKLLELGLIKRINRRSVRQYYPHGASHHIGLNIHDVADYTQALQPGMVLTVEPGIYIKREGIGVRIEDDVVITGSGNRVLSAKLTKAL